MSDNGTRFSNVRPRTRLCLDGRWLAVSREGSDLIIGVEGESEEEAIRRFDGALLDWAKLWENEPAPEEREPS